MIKQVIIVFLAPLLLLATTIYGQQTDEVATNNVVTRLFSSEEVLPIKLVYSNKEMRNETNDSTYLKSELVYQMTDGSWDTLAVKLRARGNNRRENCYFPPVKIRIKKSARAGTLFEGNKKLKLVLPCLIQSDNNDNVLKEFMAYKLYEIISPYHYKTRRVAIDFTELRRNKSKNHKLKGILIEDIDLVAERHNGKELKRAVHPLEQDNICSLQNDFFQYMIGNTDFSVAYQHNEKLIFTEDKKTMPVPYDFDMSGLVNASYSVVSQVQNETLSITSVTQRLYRGFRRNPSLYQEVRKQFLSKKPQFFEIIDGLETSFDNPKEFKAARDFIEEFFAVLADDSKYKARILNKARTK
ncbi:hypothetical protein [Muriicola sp. Z0-33]|uniref:hypothetical protein n=1 Tax=Muriicola sp. Z0-33 TaxID=2816957 RepID=UPI00223747B6|nr:hypothetical protein [Muriicola sp. Z0-33]